MYCCLCCSIFFWIESILSCRLTTDLLCFTTLSLFLSLVHGISTFCMGKLCSETWFDFDIEGLMTLGPIATVCIVLRLLSLIIPPVFEDLASSWEIYGVGWMWLKVPELMSGPHIFVKFIDFIFLLFSPLEYFDAN